MMNRISILAVLICFFCVSLNTQASAIRNQPSGGVLLFSGMIVEYPCILEHAYARFELKCNSDVNNSITFALEEIGNNILKEPRIESMSKYYINKSHTKTIVFINYR
ncbi:hypothetical protein [Klebsiella aerogenes]|uniref:hypothetical protein n=1 Tax=Klebsiella aerogenes TaxID=548 RepID=UPI002D7E8F23|nr:hypothetical protein [Klebsiella aerogenes]